MRQSHWLKPSTLLLREDGHPAAATLIERILEDDDDFSTSVFRLKSLNQIDQVLLFFGRQRRRGIVASIHHEIRALTCV
jgi:hypothetical protein